MWGLDLILYFLHILKLSCNRRRLKYEHIDFGWKRCIRYTYLLFSCALAKTGQSERTDCGLFPGLKKKIKLKGRHFSSKAEVIAAAETWLDGQLSEFSLSGLQNLEQRAKKCFELHGKYVE